MKEHIKNFNEAKLLEAHRIKEAYKKGEIDLAMANAQMKAHVGQISPEELAYIEQEFQELVDEECIKESIEEMLAIYEGVLVSDEENQYAQLPDGHPIKNYYDENTAIKGVVSRIELLFQRPYIKNEWDEQLEALNSFKTHLSRKQNQLYTALEHKGFDRPTTTMWLYDNEVRDQITNFAHLARTLEDTKSEDLKAAFDIMSEHLLDLMKKEETILYPTSLELLTQSDLVELAEGDVEIGYALIQPQKYQPSETISAESAKNAMPGGDPRLSHTSTSPNEAYFAAHGQSGEATQEVCGRADFAEELSALLGRYGMGASGGWTADTPMDVKQGKLSLNRINLLFQHLPVDISYVDENELVAFYSDTKHRVFPRSKGVIGRDVKNCHPKNSVHIVEEIIEKFRSGEQDQAEFWINKPGVFIYIKYVAVREEDGTFRGVMEMMQDCTRIRGLEGSQTLLNWASDAPKTENTEHEQIREHRSEQTKEDTTCGESRNVDKSTELEKTGCDCADAEQVEKQLKTEDCCDCGEVDGFEITPKTKLADLLKRRPELKEELPKINPAFNMLKSPMAKIIIPIATVQMMSERSGMDINALIKALKEKFRG